VGPEKKLNKDLAPSIMKKMEEQLDINIKHMCIWVKDIIT
jgi:hypothetical protein